MVSRVGHRTTGWKRQAVERVEGDHKAFPVAESIFQENFGDFSPDYDVTRDGRRFLINAPRGDAATPPITIVLNWKPPAR